MVLKSNVENSKELYNVELEMGYRPSKNLKITLSPGYTINKDELQYVDQPEYNGNQKDYVFARIYQKTLSASLRVNYNITPDLSIQYWGQPFVSSGAYNEFKKITDGRADLYTDRFHSFTENEISYNSDSEEYKIADQSGNELYTFAKPDFNIKEFLSNMVVRWEYLPGSTIYLVWSQTRSQSTSMGNFDFNNNMTDLFDTKPYNVFLLKMSFRIGR
jgi:hypothetical protein